VWDSECPNPYDTEHGPWGRGDILLSLVSGKPDSRHSKEGGKLETQVLFLAPSHAPSATLGKRLAIS